MDQIMYQKKVLDLISEVSKETSKFYAQMANVLRLYYIGLNNIFITKKILKNINYSTIQLSDEEKRHLENTGWLLDDNYLNDVYLPALKTNLILDAWLTFKSNGKTVSSKEEGFLGWYETLVASLNNDSLGTSDKEMEIGGEKFKISKNGKVDFITPEVVLSLVNKIIEIYKEN